MNTQGRAIEISSLHERYAMLERGNTASMYQEKPHVCECCECKAFVSLYEVEIKRDVFWQTFVDVLMSKSIVD